MGIASKLIGTLPTRIYSCEFAMPGKWTCILEVDEFAGTTQPHDITYLPDVGGGWFLTRKELVRQEAQQGTYHHTYEASVFSPPVSSTDFRAADLQRGVASASVTLTRQPIGMHRNFGTLQNKYKGRLLYGEWDWPQQDPTGQSTRSGTDSNGNTVSSINPMYATQEYLAPSVTLRFSKMEGGAYATPSISSNIGKLENPPQAITQLIGWAPSSRQSLGAADYGDWLLTENSSSQHADAMQVTKGWQSGQWNRILYGDRDP
jgi:hypothetical protein